MIYRDQKADYLTDCYNELACLVINIVFECILLNLAFDQRSNIAVALPKAGDTALWKKKSYEPRAGSGPGVNSLL